MKQIFTVLLAVVVGHATSFGQSTALEVYNILQGKCASCHSGSSPAANLDLQGTGANPGADVYNRLVNGAVQNSHAQSEGYTQIYPGRADRSFVFRKIHEGLEETIVLDNAEHAGGVPHGDKGLTSVEKELIRQWILFGADANGVNVERSLLENFYSGMGLESFPYGAPPAPDPSEGFQIKMGPFFLEETPSYNIEYYQKWELDLGNNREVVRINTEMGSFSHHFLLYDFNSSAEASNEIAGLRTNANHTSTSLVSAIQGPTDLRLPQGAAFRWDSDVVLDLNTHYINYQGVPYKAEVYINVYTQPIGTAAQKMNAILIPNTDICVPNTGQTHTESQTLQIPLGEIFLWGLMGHTHQLGTGYKMWESNFWQKGDMIYDGSCPTGEPGCPSPYFDYQHIPLRYFEPFHPVEMSATNGIIHEATYVNSGTDEICWGDESDDEMMVMIAFYLEDTVGVTQGPTTSIHDPINPLDEIVVAPNPMTDFTIISLPVLSSAVDFTLYDMMGREVTSKTGITENQITVNRDGLPKGIYIFRIEDNDLNQKSGKIIIN